PRLSPPQARAHPLRRRSPAAEDHAARRALAERPREAARRLPRLAREGAALRGAAGLPGARPTVRGPPPPGSPVDRLPPCAQAHHARARPPPSDDRLRGRARRLRDRARQPLPGDGGHLRDPGASRALAARGTCAARGARRGGRLPGPVRIDAVTPAVLSWP